MKKIVATISSVENLGDHGVRHEIPYQIDPQQSVQALIDDWAGQVGGYASMNADPMDRVHEFQTITLRVIEVPDE